MLLVEIISVPSREFFDGIPGNRHRLMMDYYEMCNRLSSNSKGFIRTNCLELMRCKFFECGFNQFDQDKLIDDFSDHCRRRRNECRSIMEGGFLEDMKEFVYKFVNGQ